MKELKDQLSAYIQSHRGDLLDVSHQIHSQPELAFEEHKACAILTDAISDLGHAASKGSFGLETAFDLSLIHI